jgi:hypothetical protein
MKFKNEALNSPQELISEINKENKNLDDFISGKRPISNQVGTVYSLAFAYYANILDELKSNDLAVFLKENPEYADLYDAIFQEVEKLLARIKKFLSEKESSKTAPAPTPPPTNVLIPPVTKEEPKPAEQEPKKVVTEQPTKEVAPEPNKPSGQTSFSSEEKKETKETKPKAGFFNTTNIIILMILFGAGAYFYNQKK